MMNRRITRRFFNYYTTGGSRRIDELFGAEKERGAMPFIGRLVLGAALNRTMKGMGICDDMKKAFSSSAQGRQILNNIMKTIAAHGMQQPFRFECPLVVVWNFTNVCNLHCRYCYQSAGEPGRDELSYSDKIDLVRQMADASVAFLAFSGGEPIMGDHFWDTLAYASRLMHTSLASNGTLLVNRSVVQRLADHGLKNVFISLDGASPDIHDAIRGAGAFNRTLEGITNCVENQALHVGINMVVTRTNLHEVPAVLELAQRLGVNSFNHYNFIPTGRGKGNFNLDLTAEEREQLLELLFRMHERRSETGLNIISTAPQFARVLWERSGRTSGGLFHYTTGRATDITGIIEYAGGCGAGRVYAAVQPNGRMTPCVFMPDVTIGNIRERPFKEIWQRSETCRAMVDRDSHHHKCSRYRHICGGCRARAFAYGDLLGPDPKCSVYQQATARSPVGSVDKHERNTGEAFPEKRETYVRTAAL
jgi:radical SAM protein with 4Fe4S-binding SPASM domain